MCVCACCILTGFTVKECLGSDDTVYLNVSSRSSGFLSDRWHRDE